MYKLLLDIQIYITENKITWYLSIRWRQHQFAGDLVPTVRSCDAAEIQQFRCWCFCPTLYSQTFTKSSLLLYRPRAFGGIAPPKSSSGGQNWFPSHYKSKILVKYTLRIFLPLQETKTESKLRDGGGLPKTFLAVTASEEFRGPRSVVFPRCMMESDNGS